MKSKISLATNIGNKFCVIDSKGIIIKRFRLKTSAENYAREQRKNYYCKLSVVTKIDDKEVVTTEIK